MAVEDILSDPTFKEGMTNSQLYRWNQVIWSIMWKILYFFSRFKCLSLIISALPVFLHVILVEKPIENHKFSKKNQTLISNWYLIRQSFKGYRCESGMVIFAWRVILNYPYSSPLIGKLYRSLYVVNVQLTR